MPWDEQVSPYRRVAILEIPRQESFSPARRVYAERVMSYRPWHGLVAHQPLGSINRLRRDLYATLGAWRHDPTPLPSTTRPACPRSPTSDSCRGTKLATSYPPAGACAPSPDRHGDQLHRPHQPIGPRRPRRADDRRSHAAGVRRDPARRPRRQHRGVAGLLRRLPPVRHLPAAHRGECATSSPYRGTRPAPISTSPTRTSSRFR